MHVTVFGIGYVGLVQGAVLAHLGHNVLCIDLDPIKVIGLQKGEIPIYEPGLAELIKAVQGAGNLNFSTDAKLGVLHGEIIFIAVGTPSKEDGSADVKHVLDVAKIIANHMERATIIVNKSTVPVGTANRVRHQISNILRARQVQINFSVASNPEFLKEGSAVYDCLNPDRIILGTSCKSTEQILRELYVYFDSSKIIIMNERSAELTKYAANSLLATKISFINEIANLAEYYNADIESVRKGIASDPRIGPHFISAGLGYGGSCFPKDVRALIQMAEQVNFDAKILKAVNARNVEQKNILFMKISAFFKNNIKGKVIGIWGLSFKPNTNDIREAPSCVLIDALLKAGAIIQAYDPQANSEIRNLFNGNSDLILFNKKEDVLINAHILVIITEWDEFKVPDFSLLKRHLKSSAIFDGRNLYDPVTVESMGLFYYSIGRNKHYGTIEEDEKISV